MSPSDEYGWNDRDECHGRVIGYHEVRLEQPECGDRAAAMIEVGAPPVRVDSSTLVINANPVYLTAEQAVDAALALLDAATAWRDQQGRDQAPCGPVDEADENRRWRLHVHAASVNDCTFWIQRHGEGWKATEIETGVTGAPANSAEAAMANYFARDLWPGRSS